MTRPVHRPEIYAFCSHYVMGLDVNGIKFLLFARRCGVSFETTATVGRQSMLIGDDDLASVLDLAGTGDAARLAKDLVERGGGFAEPFLAHLGAAEVVSFDASDYEGASVTHDFNFPIPDDHKGRFSAILDGGTLEHIFNYPQALKNCMEMVRPGGHFLAITPANNHLGHGFYQFSPELFFRVFSEANGFELESLMIFEETKNCDWYEVTDPDAVRERVTLVNEEPSMMLVMAKKAEEKEIFATPPQQSDYFAVWSTHEHDPDLRNMPVPGTVRPESGFARLWVGAWKRFQRTVNRTLGMLNRRSEHFKKVDPFAD